MEDIAIQPVKSSNLINLGSVKTIFLIVVEQNKKNKLFLTIDRPDLQNSFVQAKGFFVDFSEEEASSNYNNILTNTSKDVIVEVILPWHKISIIKNLIFKAK